MANTPKLGIRLIEGTDVVNFQGMNNILKQIDQHGHPAGDITGILSPEHGGTGKASLDEALAGCLPLKGGTLTGPLDAPTIKESGVSLKNKYAPKTHTHRASDITNIRDYIRDAFFPVGAIWQSTSADSPASIIGGTWEAIESGRFLVAAGGDYAVESKGGAATQRHGLEDGYAKIMFGGMVGGYLSVSMGIVPKDVPDFITPLETNAANKPWTRDITRTHGAALGGTTDSADNRPPYYAVYMFRRIA